MYIYTGFSEIVQKQWNLINIPHGITDDRRIKKQRRERISQGRLGWDLDNKLYGVTYGVTYVLPMCYLCVTYVLPMRYLCVTYVLPMRYLCVTYVLPMCYLCVTYVLPMCYLCVT
jgi:hypothetical protein